MVLKVKAVCLVFDEIKEISSTLAEETPRRAL